MDRSIAGQYVTVGVGEEIFAFAVSQVREVLDLCPVTRVPNMPTFVRGMIDVRGKPVPVLDMRAKFGLPETPHTPQTRIVVIEVPAGERSLVMGALTDRVYEVLDITADSIEPPPEVGVRWRSDVISGIGRRGDRFVIILDLPRLFFTEGAALAEVAA